MPLHDFLHECQRRSLVPSLAGKGLQRLAIDADIDLVQMPEPMGVCPHVTYRLPADLRGEHRAEPVPP